MYKRKGITIDEQIAYIEHGIKCLSADNDGSLGSNIEMEKAILDSLKLLRKHVDNAIATTWAQSKSNKPQHED